MQLLLLPDAWGSCGISQPRRYTGYAWQRSLNPVYVQYGSSQALFLFKVRYLHLPPASLIAKPIRSQCGVYTRDESFWLRRSASQRRQNTSERPNWGRLCDCRVA